MRKLMQLALVAGIGYVAWEFFKIKAAVDQLRYQVSGISNVSAKLVQTQLQAVLNIYNPSAVNLKFQSFSGIIYNSLTPVASVAVPQPVSIAPGGITQVPMDVTIQNDAALPIADNLLSGNLDGLTLQGTIMISLIPVPVNINLGNG